MHHTNTSDLEISLLLEAIFRNMVMISDILKLILDEGLPIEWIFQVLKICSNAINGFKWWSIVNQTFAGFVTEMFRDPVF
jgi:hypothetical protein